MDGPAAPLGSGPPVGFAFSKLNQKQIANPNSNGLALRYIDANIHGFAFSGGGDKQIGKPNEKKNYYVSSSST